MSYNAALKIEEKVWQMSIIFSPKHEFLFIVYFTVKRIPVDKWFLFSFGLFFPVCVCVSNLPIWYNFENILALQPPYRIF